MLLEVFILGLLLAILVQDLRYRAVSVLLFALLAVALFCWRLQKLTWVELLVSTGSNLALVSLNLILATVYFSIKRKAFTKLTNGLMGLGDIVFLICLAIAFNFSEFILALPASLLFALMAWFLLSRSKEQAKKKVPLAGLQALFLAGFIVLSLAGFNTNLTSSLFGN